jgi:hypothetical protein
MRLLKSTGRVVVYAVFLACDLSGQPPPALDHTATLELRGDLAAQMVEGIHRYLDRATAAVGDSREQFWKRDYQSAERYNQSVAPNRDRLRRIIGTVDPRLTAADIRLAAANPEAPAIGSGAGYKIYAVRWRVFEGVDGEGVLLEPEGRPAARIVAVPDADWTPEMLAGMMPGVDASAQYARRLAENGCEVLVPVLIDRADTWSGIPAIRMTNQPHREWIYRMAYEVGRHIAGYEVQKVLAAVDWFTRRNEDAPVPIGVAGYGEGGLIALYSAALDPRIQATLVSGYFQRREGLWTEPVYRDFWGLLREFGDAELASLVAPRALVVEASRGPHISGPPSLTKERQGAAPNGVLADPPLDSVRAEIERARPHFAKLEASQHLRLIVSGDGHGLPGCQAALEAFMTAGSSWRTSRIGSYAYIYAASFRSGRAITRAIEPAGDLHAEIDRHVGGPSRRVLVESRLVITGTMEPDRRLFPGLYMGRGDWAASGTDAAGESAHAVDLRCAEVSRVRGGAGCLA